MEALVTGPGGLGFETAAAFAQAGASVILAGRSPDKGEAALRAIRARTPAANVRFELLDLASLGSIDACARRLIDAGTPLDVLVNNAGVMTPPRRQTTSDGFELQFGTNYLGHYALTAHLMPLLRRAPAPRVTSVASVAHLRARIDFDDLQGERKYGGWRQYGESKLAMILFARELQRRSDLGGWGVLSNAAHPGFAQTDLIANGAGAIPAMLSRIFTGPVSHSAGAGAQPQIYAATSPDALPGGYYGPSGPMELRGPTGIAHVAKAGRDPETARRLWDVSAELTAVSWPTTP